MARGSGRLWPASPWASQAPGLCRFTSDKRVSLASHLGRGSGRAGLVEGPWASSLGTGSVIRGVQPRARLGQGGQERGRSASSSRFAHAHAHVHTQAPVPASGRPGPCRVTCTPVPPTVVLWLLSHPPAREAGLPVFLQDGRHEEEVDGAMELLIKTRKLEMA